MYICMYVYVYIYVYIYIYTGVPPYPQVKRSKTYRGYVKPRIIQNAVHVQRDIRVTNINTVKFIDK
jgi:hypothetical protein